jgi:hypothetical protein
MAGMLAAAEAAQELGQDAHPESAFIVGSTYAKMQPPQKEKAVRMLNSFTKRACRSAKAAQFKEQCETAASLLQQMVAPAAEVARGLGVGVAPRRPVAATLGWVDEV